MDRDQLLNDQITMLKVMMDGRQASIWTALPGILTGIDFDTFTCRVQPSIKGVITDEDGNQTQVALPELLDVPIVFPKGGGFLITFPLAVGDEVLVVFSSRCIDAWWQQGNVQGPMETRMHDLSDGFAIPGPYSVPKIPSGTVSTTNLQIRNSSGLTYVEIDAAGKIGLVSPSEIDVTAPLLNLTGNVVITGTLVCGALTCASIGTTGSGAASIGGALTAASVAAGGKDLATHVHSGVTTGGGNTGPPV